MERWEVGGFFGLPALAPSTVDEPAWLPAEARLFGTGRQALRALLRHGVEEPGWQVALVPSYYCDDVTRSILKEIPIEEYPATPDRPTALPDPRPGQVVLAMATFGIAPPGLDAVPGDRLIVDVSHDPLAPWVATLPPCWVVASLRKTLPVPDGGAVWTTGTDALPEPAAVQPAHAHGCALMLSAMLLRTEYLAGGDLDKDAYLALRAEAERAYDDDRPGAISTYSRGLLPLLPAHEMRRSRLRNIQSLRRWLLPSPDVAQLESTFGGILHFSTPDLREAVRAELHRHDVYPAVIWPTTGPFGQQADRDFAARMLKVYADYRYADEDMHRVADIVNAVVAGR